jgi:hypothetical protein
MSIFEKNQKKEAIKSMIYGFSKKLKWTKPFKKLTYFLFLF